MKSILAMAGKDLILLVRDKAGFFFVFFFPMIYALFFGAIFSGQGGGMSAMSVAVVDEDGTETSRKFVEKLQAAGELEVTLTGREEAESLVRRGKRVAYIMLPKGFAAAQERIFHGEGLRIEVGLDPGRKAESGMLQGIVTQYAFQVLQDVFMDRGAMRKQIQTAMNDLDTEWDVNPLTKAVLNRFFQSVDTFLVDLPEEEDQQDGGEASDSEVIPDWNPIQVEFTEVRRKKEGVPKTSFDITIPQAFVWVFLGCSAAFGISLVTERTRGTLLRLRSSPVTLGQILAGKAVACFTTCMAALIVLFIIFALIFKVRPDSYPLLLLAFVSATLAFVGIMMFISVLGKTENSAGGVGWALLLVMAMIGGGMVPLIMLPSWMKTVSHISFVKWAVLAMEGAVWRSFSLKEMLLPCGILIGIGIVAFGAGVRLFKVTVD
ncbi:MAG: ABC transporter permease [Planctomycetota bacterium]|jgi:ABC-2 type transport system permease protein